MIHVRFAVRWLCLLLALGAAPAARGQYIDQSAPLSTDETKAIGEILNLSDDQRASMKLLYDGATAAYAKGVKKLNREVQRFYEDTNGENTSDNPEYKAKNEDFIKRSKNAHDAARAAILVDIKGILTADQLQSWPKVERWEHRQLLEGWYTLHNSDAHWYTLDLIAIVKGMKFPPDDLAAIEAAMNTYEIKLDGVIVRSDPIVREFSKEHADVAKAYKAGDVDGARASFARAQSVRGPMSELNRAAARQIETLLSEPSAARWRMKIQQLVYEDLYRYAGRRAPELKLAAADALANLDAPQRDALAAIRSTYERDRDEMLRQTETEFERVCSDDRVIMDLDFLSTSKLAEPFWRAFHARRLDLEIRTVKSIDAILTPEQIEALPGLVPPPPKEEP